MVSWTFGGSFERGEEKPEKGKLLENFGWLTSGLVLLEFWAWGPENPIPGARESERLCS
jgi:hypothetical protein